MKERYYLIMKDGTRIYFEFNLGGYRRALKFIQDNDDLLQHQFNDDRVTIYYEEVK